MVLLTSQLMFEQNGNRILSSIVYDEVADRFVRISQRISAELVQDLASSNPVVDIETIIDLDYVDYVFDDEEMEEVFEMVDEQMDHYLVRKAKEFITSYKRDKKIDKLL